MRVALLIVGLCSTASALAAQPSLERAQRYYANLKFGMAVYELERLLERPGNSRADLVAAYETMGLSHAAMHDEGAAERAFLHLLMLEPGHELPDYVAPRMRKMFEAARHKAQPLGALEAQQSIGPPEPGAAPTVELRITNDPLGMVREIRVAYRGGGDPAPRTKAVPAVPVTRVRLDATPPVAYWCTLLDRNGGQLLHLGTAEQPLTTGGNAASPMTSGATTRPPPTAATVDDSPWWSEWWVWATIGVVVAGATTATILATRPQTPECTGDVCAHLP